MALACEPALLVADEPTTALDVTIQAQILELLAKLKEQLGMGVILITHDLGVVAEVASHVLVMYAGRVVESAPVKRLFSHPRHPYTGGLLRSLPSFDKAVAHAPVTPEREGHAKNEPTRRARLPVIEGLVPDLLALPPGCRFADRCPMVIPACTEAEPELLPVSAEGDVEHLARCIRANEV
jgi:oligopeptide/dipeptide ABC transporter ATP-binding protein